MKSVAGKWLLPAVIFFFTASVEAAPSPSVKLSGVGLEGLSLSSWAIIKVDESPDEIFFEGDRIPRVGILKKIRRNCVDIIDDQYASRTVCLRGDSPTAKNSHGQHVRPSIQRPEPGPLIASARSAEHWMGNEGSGRTILDENGTALGFLIERLQESAFLKQLGFEEGDVILSLNGKAVRSVDDLSSNVLKFNDDIIEFGFERDRVARTREIRISESAVKLFSKVNEP